MEPGFVFNEVEEYIFQNLPKVLLSDPRFVVVVEGIVAEKFPRRDEFARMLEQLEQHRHETATSFTRTDARVDQTEVATQGNSQTISEGFAHTDARIDQVETAVQEHRQETTAGFARTDARIDQVEAAVQEHRQETKTQFEQIDKHFEQVDEQFEQIKKRFEQVDQRFDQVDQRFEQVDQRFDRLEQRIEDSELAVQKSIDRLGSRWGIRNEKIFRMTMRSLLTKSFGVQVEERWINDEQYDCVIVNGQHILIEISASVGRDIVRKLERKLQAYIDETGITPARVLLVVNAVSSKRAEALRTAGFEVIEPEDEDDTITV